MNRPMERDAHVVTCVITCESPERVRAVEQYAREKLVLDNDYIDIARSFPSGTERRIERHYRLGDIFSDVQLVSNPANDATSFSLVFRLRPDADRYWKDLLVNILQSISHAGSGVSITSIIRSS